MLTFLYMQGDGEGFNTEAAEGLPFHPSMSLPLDRRRSIGAMCKQLIDAGRLHFLQRHGFPTSHAVAYVDGSVTGENRMLIGRRHACGNCPCRD